MKRLFISWGGSDAQKIAEWIKRNAFKNIHDLEVYVSALVPFGVQWRNELSRNLSEADWSLGILTDAALNRPWFLFELASLQQRLGKLPILRFCAQPPDNHPLSEFKMADGTDFLELTEFVQRVLNEHNPAVREMALELLGSKQNEWETLVGPIVQRAKETAEISQSLLSVIESLSDPRLNSDLRGNICTRRLTTKAITDLSDTFQAFSKFQTFRVERSQYPDYLIYLQDSLRKFRTVAVAVVDEIEEFWAQNTGNEILNSTQAGSERIFVFKKPDALTRYAEHISRHAVKYSVYAMSINDFNKAGKPYGVKLDLSVITDLDTGNQVTASYDDNERYIEFTSRADVIRNHLRAFESIKSKACRVRPRRDDPESDYSEELKKHVFVRGTDLYHSSVVSIPRYDIYEEDHPFYREMHESMLGEFRERCERFRNKEVVDILEIGAGTGHFTKRIAQQRLMPLRIKALEPDPGATEYLDRKVKALGVDVVAADFLHYDPPGVFDFIFSSFSDHHIKSEDRATYFANVIRNLREGGYFIVGDEFLPPYNTTDPADYERALEAYHGFIIEEAKKRHCWEVVSLEQEALESGRPGSPQRVDFKVNLQEYLRCAQSCGLRLVSQACISPESQAPQLGGMHVLVFESAKAAG